MFDDRAFYPPTEEITYDALGSPQRAKVYGKVQNLGGLSPLYMTLANVVDTQNTPQLLKNRPKSSVEQVMIPSSLAYQAIAEDLKAILQYKMEESRHQPHTTNLDDLKYIKLTDGEKKGIVG